MSQPAKIDIVLQYLLVYTRNESKHNNKCNKSQQFVNLATKSQRLIWMHSSVKITLKQWKKILNEIAILWNDKNDNKNNCKW